METKTTWFLYFSIVFSPLFIFPSSQLFIKQFQSPVTTNKSIFIEPLQSINFYQLSFLTNIYLHLLLHRGYQFAPKSSSIFLRFFKAIHQNSRNCSVSKNAFTFRPINLSISSTKITRQSLVISVRTLLPIFSKNSLSFCPPSSTFSWERILRVSVIDDANIIAFPSLNITIAKKVSTLQKLEVNKSSYSRRKLSSK